MQLSHASPIASLSVSYCSGLYVQPQLSHASPIASQSGQNGEHWFAWSRFCVYSQLSHRSPTSSASRSNWSGLKSSGQLSHSSVELDTMIPSGLATVGWPTGRVPITIHGSNGSAWPLFSPGDRQ